MLSLTMSAEESRSPWLSKLFVFTLIQTSAFVSVTLLQFYSLNDVQRLDDVLELQLRSFSRPKIRQRRHTENKRQGGFLSELLLNQEKILAQHCVHKDQACQAGDLGDKGTKGESGERGERGDTSVKGEQGINGLPGEKGDIGIIGLPGEMGNSGEQGVEGHIGATGEKGDAGSKGNKGQTGEVGLKGLQGDGGFPGLKGSPGLQGDKGDTGDIGPVGEKGIPGPQGSQGLQGPSGKDIKQIPDGCECLKPPTFQDGQETQLYVQSGSSKTIPCQATGNPPPTVKVTKTTRRRGLVEYTNNHQTFSRFSNFGQGDEGRYKCVATNAVGRAEKYVNVSTGVLPKLTITPQSLELPRGTSIELTCAASGVPNPDISFFHDGVLVNTTSGYFVTSGHLTIRHTVPDDTGKYRCEARNSLGLTFSQEWTLRIT